MEEILVLTPPHIEAYRGRGLKDRIVGFLESTLSQPVVPQAPPFGGFNVEGGVDPKTYADIREEYDKKIAYAQRSYEMFVADNKGCPIGLGEYSGALDWVFRKGNI